MRTRGWPGAPGGAAAYSARMSPPRRRAVLLGALGLLGLVAALLADWNWWARPALVHYLAHKSGREVRLESLQVRLDANGQPVVRMRGLYVGNAPWATGERPFITAREADFTFDWATLFAPLRLMRELHLVEADVDLQRRPDGLRNWRLTRPDDRGDRPRMRIQRLRAERSRLTLIHGGRHLAFEARSTPLSAPADGHTQRIEFSGRYHGAGWAGAADAGPVLTLWGTGEYFPVRGEAKSGSTTLVMQGRIADLMRLDGGDAAVQVQGRSLADLQPFLQRGEIGHWPPSRPYRFEGRIAREAGTWRAHGATLQLGRSVLAGDARFTPARFGRDGRAVVEADLKSERLRVEDLPQRAAPGPGTRAASSGVLPQQALPFDLLQRVEGRVVLQVAALDGPAGLAARDLRLSATAQSGDLQVQLHEARFGGGRWQGRVALDARTDRPRLALQLRAEGVQPQALWPALAREPGVRWPAAEGRLALSTHGATLANWWRGLAGQLDLRVAGGSLPRKLDARLGLHAGRMLSALVTGDQPVPIRCGAVSLAFDGGVGRTRELVIETERTQVHGAGRLDLPGERWSVVLTPQASGGALPASIVAQGSFQAVDVELGERQEVPAARCTNPRVG